jgi:hypothetical protein
MKPHIFSGNNFAEIREVIRLFFIHQSDLVTTNAWQGTRANPNALTMRELLHVTVNYDIPSRLEQLQEDVQPFLPWADDHFETERVSGQPINPGETYKFWRYPASASQHTDTFRFNHSYAERYWPKYANRTYGGVIDETIAPHLKPRMGIRHEYGDLDTLVTVLYQDPTTRQAYLPIFYPEDLTAAVKQERVPCTLGYHFILRNNRMDIVYPMRSCDFVRHFDDDVYLTARLLMYVLGKLVQMQESSESHFDGVFPGRKPDAIDWKTIKPGSLLMYITSFHCFHTDVL